MAQFFWPPQGGGATTVTANQGAPGNPATPWFVQPTDGTNLQTFNADGSANVVRKNTLFSLPYDQLTVLTKGANGPLTIQSKLLGANVQLMTITYDIDGDFQKAVVT
jgi:hypothetical protein